jgi:predicted transcriptional regulator YdeE
MTINELPTELQTKVRDTLSAYDVAYVTRENGEFTYTAGLSLDTRKKASDFKTFTFTKDDAYTEAEQAENLRALNASFAKMNVSDSFWN